MIVSLFSVPTQDGPRFEHEIRPLFITSRREAIAVSGVLIPSAESAVGDGVSGGGGMENRSAQRRAEETGILGPVGGRPAGPLIGAGQGIAKRWFSGQNSAEQNMSHVSVREMTEK
ncbi:hypothetical protein [Streptomyces sp. NPDC051662]|uniref:hypothetical protein n=1 Tax=Streptomyces sp. NPDC051662 TaxID=3154750 RepID=UPI00344900DC